MDVNLLLTNLINKNVFIFDTETTGLPERVPNAKWGSSNEYWLYSINEKYDKSRIVSIAWSSINSFTKLKLKDTEEALNPIHHYIRFPEGFNEIPTSHIHGITIEIANTSGVLFNDIFEKNGLYNALMSSEYIIAHNVFFDIYILLNELHRLNTEKSIKTILHIQSLIALDRCICTGNISKDICKLEFKNTKFTHTHTHINKKSKIQKTYKMPKLTELYTYYYGSEMLNAHNAGGDVKALKMCLLKMLDT